MSGHSKWSKVKHQKATTDVVKGLAFTKAAHAITIAVGVGGGVGDPNLNFHLRLAIEKAHEVNMPKENIARAIEKGKGGSGDSVEQVVYEAYGPGGVAMLIEAATDNRQRTVSSVKNVLERLGCTLASPGAVNYLFTRSGVLTVPKTVGSYDTLVEIALETGADDVVETIDVYEVYASPHALAGVKQKFEEKGIVIDNVALIMKPTTTVPLDSTKYDRLNNIVEELENLDDVQHVYTNAANEL